MRKLYMLLFIALLVSCSQKAPNPEVLPIPDFSETVLGLIDSTGREPDKLQFEPPYDDFGLVVYSTNLADYQTSSRYFFIYNEELDLFEMDTVDYTMGVDESKNWSDCVYDFKAFKAYGDEHFEQITNTEGKEQYYSEWKTVDPQSGKWLLLTLDLRKNPSSILFWYTISTIKFEETAS